MNDHWNGCPRGDYDLRTLDTPDGGEPSGAYSAPSARWRGNGRVEFRAAAAHRRWERIQSERKTPMNEQGMKDVAAEIEQIMAVYHEQEKTSYGVDTPGGLEHMGDVWRLFLEWERKLLKEDTTP